MVAGSLPQGSIDVDRRDTAVRLAVSAKLAECRVALQEQLARGASVELAREPVVEFATLARKHGVPPERLLAVFKEMLNHVLEIGNRDIGERSKVTHALVAMSIEAYYGAHR